MSATISITTLMSLLGLGIAYFYMKKVTLLLLCYTPRNWGSVISFNMYIAYIRMFYLIDVNDQGDAFEYTKIIPYN